jgi:hypothetical protein
MGQAPDPLPPVRQAVRALLLSTPAYRELEPARQRALARAMVKVCHAATELILEEAQSVEPPPQAAGPPAFAVAQSAGSDFSGVSAQRVAGTTRAILDAVSFPRFVTELINGVFKAMVDSSMQQMNAFVELLNNVAASTEGFAASNMGADQARAWLAERYPASFEVIAEDGDPEPGQAPKLILQLRSGGSMPSPEALRTDLDIAEGEAAPSGDPETALVPFARRRLAKKRQEMLATMVMLGMQRIVIESGRINAAMRFHIDTRSAAEADQGSTVDFRNTINGGVSYGVAGWGASVAMTNTIGYVSTQKSHTTEELNTDLDLSSSVEVNFKSDYLPLDRLASAGQVSRIQANTRNPEAEAKAAEDARSARRTAATTSDAARRTALDRQLAPPGAPPPPAPGSPGTVGAADKARTEADERERKAAAAEKKPEAKAEEKPVGKPDGKAAAKPEAVKA